jgi:hypothetical protein
MSMTMTYARIADRTVAEEYFALSEKVEALYTADPLPAAAEGPNMRRLRAETTRRLLGNGYCRPSTTTPPKTVTRIDRTSTRRYLPASTETPLDSHHRHKRVLFP